VGTRYQFFGSALWANLGKLAKKGKLAKLAITPPNNLRLSTVLTPSFVNIYLFFFAFAFPEPSLVQSPQVFPPFFR
jgi:hypothetical protein